MTRKSIVLFLASFFLVTLLLVNVKATTSIFYPHYSDGYIYHFGSVWNTVHSANSGTEAYSSTTYAKVGTTDYFKIYRGFFVFDTSSLPDDATITSASLRIWVTTCGEYPSGHSIYLVPTTQASASSLVVADYSRIGTVQLSTSHTIVSISTGEEIFVFEDLSYINKIGSTKIGLRDNDDLFGTTPSENQETKVWYNTYEQSDSKPYLNVTWTDTTPPTIGTVQVQPTSGSYTKATFTVKASVSGDDANASTCQICHGTTTPCTNWVTGTYSDGYCYKTGITGYSNGNTIYVNVRIKDNSGNQGTGTQVSRTIDSVAPTTTASAVDDIGASYTFNTWTSSNYVNVTLSCNDGTGSGCNVTQYCTDTENTCTPTTTYIGVVQISTEGTSYIRFKSNDNVGNDEASVNSKTIKIDSVAPTTTASAVDDIGASYTFNTWTSSNYVNVTLSCNDGTGSGCNVTQYCTDTENTCTPTTTYIGVVQISTEGTSYIRYRSNDIAENLETIKSQTIKIDTIAPTISATFPSNNSYLSQTWINITGIASDVNPSTIIINDTKFGSNQGTYVSWNFTNTSVIFDSNYSVKITANDSAGNENFTIISFAYDTTYPAISITFPANNSYLNQAWINITGTASDTNYDTIVINDTRFGSNQGTYQNWNFTNSSIAEGDYSVKVTANDSAGNENSTILHFTIDRTNPSISYNPATTPEGNYSQNYVFVNITCSDTSKDTVIFNWDGTNETFDNSAGDYYWENKTSLDDGTHTFYAWCNDLATNSNLTATRTIILDTTPPTITIIRPKEIVYSYGTNLPLNYTSIDATLSVDSCWYKVINSTSDIIIDNTTIAGCGNTTFNVPRDDTYNVTVYSNDSVSNLGSSVRQFAVSTDKPAISLDYPTDNKSLDNGIDVYFNFTAIDNDGISMCKLYANFTGTWSENQTFTGVISGTQNYTQKNLTEGIYVWNVWCNDTFGKSNWALSNFTVTIDIPPPSFISATGWDVSMNQEETVYNTWAIKNYGSITFTECYGRTNSSLNSYVSFNINNFSLVPNESKDIRLTITTPAEGNYIEEFSVTCKIFGGKNKSTTPNPLLNVKVSGEKIGGDVPTGDGETETGIEGCNLEITSPKTKIYFAGKAGTTTEEIDIIIKNTQDIKDSFRFELDGDEVKRYCTLKSNAQDLEGQSTYTNSIYCTFQKSTYEGKVIARSSVCSKSREIVVSETKLGIIASWLIALIKGQNVNLGFGIIVPGYILILGMVLLLLIIGLIIKLLENR